MRWAEQALIVDKLPWFRQLERSQTPDSCSQHGTPEQLVVRLCDACRSG